MIGFMFVAGSLVILAIFGAVFALLGGLLRLLGHIVVFPFVALGFLVKVVVVGALGLAAAAVLFPFALGAAIVLAIPALVFFGMFQVGRKIVATA